MYEINVFYFLNGKYYYTAGIKIDDEMFYLVI